MLTLRKEVLTLQTQYKLTHILFPLCTHAHFVFPALNSLSASLLYIPRATSLSSSYNPHKDMMIACS